MKARHQIDILIIYHWTANWETFLATRFPLWLEFAKIFGSKVQILCVYRPIDFLITPLVNPRRVRQWLAERRKLQRAANGVHVLSPVILVHEQVAHYIPLLERANRLLISWQISRAVATLGIEANRLINCFTQPLQHSYMGTVAGDLTIYECSDDWATFPGLSGRTQEVIRQHEEKLFRDVDLVFTTSHKLFGKAGRLNENTYLVLNTADASLFKRALTDALTIPEDLVSVPRPVIGFAGSIFGIVDLHLVHYLAVRHPEWSIVLIGPLAKDNADLQAWAELKRLDNVNYLGRKDYYSLPAYYKGFDVCLLPYQRMPYSDSVFPSKIFQYLAAGKPVVSIGISGLDQFSDIVKLAQDYQTFEQHVCSALHENEPSLTERRVGVAEENSFAVRVKQMWDIIQEHLAKAV